MAVKKVTSNKKVKGTSLRAKAKQSQKKIATSPDVRRGSRNDAKKIGGLSVPVYSLAGRVSGTLSLPKEIFGSDVNQKLLAQAARVYMANQKSFTAKTKSRGEVRGSSAKIFRQKGTGRARHGSIRAPIFVGGGIVFGPKPRKVMLDLPKKIKKKALIHALSSKAKDKEVVGLQGVEKATGRTKEIAKLLEKIRSVRPASPKTSSRGGAASGNALIVTADKQDNMVRGIRNIPDIDVLPVNLINSYEVLRHELLLITKDAVTKLGAKK